MNNEDMSDVIKNLSSMLNSNNIPDNVKDFLNNFQASNGNASNLNDNKDVSFNNSENTSNFNTNFQNNNGSSTTDTQNSGIDMDTILKISKIVSKMNNTQNDARANLLLSLKPYLKESRRNKVEQYVKLLNMSKVLEVISPNDNEKVK